MIMVLSCFDCLVVITKHPLGILRLVFWLNGMYDLLAIIQTYEQYAALFIGFSVIALLVLSFERYLGAYYPFFHRTSVTRRRLLTLLAILFILPIILVTISVNGLVISFPMALMIFFVFVFPPFAFINYKLFKISRKMRRDNITSPNVAIFRVNLKKISTCLLAVACLVLMYTPAFFFIAFNFAEKLTSENTMVSRVWTATISAANSTLNCLIFFWKNDVLRREGIKVLKTLKNRIFPC